MHLLDRHDREPLGVAAMALLALLLVLLGGCATGPDRVVRTDLQARAAVVPGYGAIRSWADAPAADFAERRREVAAQRPAGTPDILLAISGGADDGAYAAGLLNGWSEAGDRPEFTVVSGVSTGALIAPFAFLGPAYDARLRDFYTGISRADILRRRGVVGLLTKPSVADSAPLAKLIAANVDAALLDAVAVEHRRGRRLLVQTTDLDAARGVVWDMGAIADSGRPDRVALFRLVLLASASVPGLFPPVPIDVTAEGQRFAELHVDGAVTSGFFALPQSLFALSPGEAIDLTREQDIYVILNDRLRPQRELVEPSTFAIVGRALAVVLSAYDRASLSNVQQFAATRAIGFHLSWIGDDFNQTSDGLFSQDYMRALYAHGLARGRSGAAWVDRLPED